MSDTGKMRVHTDVFAGLILLLISGYVFFQSRSMPVTAQRWPVLLSILFALPACIIFIGGIMKSLSNSDTEKFFDWSRNKYAFAVLGLTVLYVIGIKILTFFAATTLFIPGLMFFMGVRSWKTIVINTLGMNLFIWAVFVWQLGIRLP